MDSKVSFKIQDYSMQPYTPTGLGSCLIFKATLHCQHFLIITCKKMIMLLWKCPQNTLADNDKYIIESYCN